MMLKDLEAKVRKKFEADTAGHVMRIFHDVDNYRHLRCQQPLTWMYGFNVVSWPGYLAIVGDNGDYMFSRVPDMFEFFSTGRLGYINPQYWAEKLQGPGHDTARVYSPERFEQRVNEWLQSAVEQIEDEPDTDRAKRLELAVKEDILRRDHYHEEEARGLLSNFRAEGFEPIDSFEWQLREFDERFLWCCFAIVWAIERYYKVKA